MTRRKIVEMGDKSSVATMAEPTSELAERCLIMLAFHARELLSNVERNMQTLGEAQSVERHAYQHRSHHHLAEALSYLRAALFLVEQCRVRSPGSVGASDVAPFLHGAIQATLSTQGHLGLYGVYAADADEDAEIAKRADKQRRVCRRSAETAKKEAHRALVALLDAYPDAWEVDDE